MEMEINEDIYKQTLSTVSSQLVLNSALGLNGLNVEAKRSTIKCPMEAIRVQMQNLALVETKRITMCTVLLMY